MITHTRSQDFKIVEPTPIIIVEGILLFAFDSLCQRLDYLVFRDCPESIRFKRRIENDLSKPGKTQESIENQLTHTVKTMHDLFVQPYKHKADFVTLHNNNLEEVTSKIISEITEHNDEIIDLRDDQELDLTIATSSHSELTKL